jgi:hypothetical protein
MRGGGPEGPETGDGLGGFAGLRWEQARQVDVSGFPGGRRGARMLAVADAAAIAIAVTLIAASLILGRPIGGVVLLLGPGILLLVVGQVAAIVVMRARRPSRTGRRFSSDPGRRGSISGDLRSSFGPLDRRVTRAVAVLSLIGFLSFISGIIFTFHGGPAGPGGGLRVPARGSRDLHVRLRNRLRPSGSGSAANGGRNIRVLLRPALLRRPREQ